MKPVKIQIAYEGEFKGHSSGAFSLSSSDLNQIVEDNKERDIAIDIEHLSLNSDIKNTNENKIAGWIKRGSLSISEGKLFGDAELTDTVRDKIKNSQIRYISPVLQFGKKENHSGEKRRVWLYNVGLTNTPFMYKNQAIKINSEDGADIETNDFLTINTLINGETYVQQKEKELQMDENKVVNENVEVKEETKVNSDYTNEYVEKIVLLSDKVSELTARLTEAETKSELFALGLKPAYMEKMINFRKNSEDVYQEVKKDIPENWLLPKSELSYKVDDTKTDSEDSIVKNNEEVIEELKNLNIRKNSENWSVDKWEEESYKLSMKLK